MGGLAESVNLPIAYSPFNQSDRAIADTQSPVATP